MNVRLTATPEFTGLGLPVGPLTTSTECATASTPWVNERVSVMMPSLTSTVSRQFFCEPVVFTGAVQVVDAAKRSAKLPTPTESGHDWRHSKVRDGSGCRWRSR